MSYILLFLLYIVISIAGGALFMHIEGQEEYNACKKLDKEIVMAKEVRSGLLENSLVTFNRPLQQLKHCRLALPKKKPGDVH